MLDSHLADNLPLRSPEKGPNGASFVSSFGGGRFVDAGSGHTAYLCGRPCGSTAEDVR